MTTQLFELRPKRHLLNPDFNGYKLSLEKIPILKQQLETPVYRVYPNSDQYSLLHARLFSLHNHLFTDYYNNCDVYFIDMLFNVQKVRVNKSTGRLENVNKVFEIPGYQEKISGKYNASLQFVSSELAVLSDGIKTLYVITTGNRLQESNWTIIFFGSVLKNEKPFIIIDAVFKQKTNELHCLLFQIENNKQDKFMNVINWIVLKKNDTNWHVNLKTILKASGSLYYCHLEANCEYIYIASDQSFKTEHSVTANSPQHNKVTKKLYSWTQTKNDITIRFNIDSNCNKDIFGINIQPTSIEIKYKDDVLLSGQLTNRIDSELTVWDKSDKYLEITVTKYESGLMWSELISGDEFGEQIIDASLVAEVHEKLAHLCSEEIVEMESGPSFNSQQIEECDLEGDNTVIFERISEEQVTHRINLGSHQVIMSVQLSEDSPPAIVTRHDVDACIWVPQEQTNESWHVDHIGTLFAFGYIQASKQQRKFLSCSPDLNYSVICESKRHVFIYKQNKTVNNDLRNRKTMQKIKNIAQQQVISLDDDEILGISTSNDILYLLTEKSILILKMNCRDEE